MDVTQISGTPCCLQEVHKTSGKGECALVSYCCTVSGRKARGEGSVCVCVCARTHMCTPLHTSLCWAAKQHSANNLWYFSIYRISAALDSTTFFRGNAPPSILLIQVWEFGSLTHTHTHTHTRIGGNAIQDNKNSFLASPNLKEERHNLSSDKAEDVSWKPLTPWAVAVL